MPLSNETLLANAGKVIRVNSGGTDVEFVENTSGAQSKFVILPNDTLAQELATNINTRLTVTANRTLTTTVPGAGIRCSVQIKTSGTVSRTVTFGTGFKPQTTLATGTANARYFTVEFLSDGVNLVEVSRSPAVPA